MPPADDAPGEIARRILAEAAIPPRPRRIACLTEETVETLYRIGAGDLVVGVSAYVKRPPEARRKPRVSAFVKADFGKIEAVRPDLVLCFSDLQAEIAAECARRGLPVVVFNQRSVAEILAACLAVGALVGREREAEALVHELRGNLEETAAKAALLPRRPAVHFEEWDDPLVTGILWVAELIEVAGGTYLWHEKAAGKAAADRVVDPADVAHKDPDLILASWCGKRMRRETIVSRPGWAATKAVRLGRVHEVDPTLILQPGPAALSDGLAVVHRLIAAAARG